MKAIYSGDANYLEASTELAFDTAKQMQEGFAISPIDTKIYGDEPFTLSTTGGSGTGEVTFESSDPDIIRIDGNTAFILRAGTVQIRAIKAGDDQYNEAVSETSVTVLPRDITVTAQDKSVVKGQPMPEFTYTAQNLVNGDTFTRLPDMAATVPDTNAAGQYEITISGGTLTNAESYHVNYQNGTLTIEEIFYTLTVNLDNGSGQTVSGNYPAGTVVPIDAGTRSGYTFAGWTSTNGGSFLDSQAANTTFTMPDGDTTITAAWKESKNSDEDSSTGDGSDSETSDPGDTGGGKPSGLQTEVPQTGDSAGFTPWLFILCISLGMFAVTLLIKQRGRYDVYSTGISYHIK